MDICYIWFSIFSLSSSNHACVVKVVDGLLPVDHTKKPFQVPLDLHQAPFFVIRVWHIVWHKAHERALPSDHGFSSMFSMVEVGLMVWFGSKELMIITAVMLDEIYTLFDCSTKAQAIEYLICELAASRLPRVVMHLEMIILPCQDYPLAPCINAPY